MRWLCGGVLLGGFLQMVVPAIDLMRVGWRPRLDLSLSPAENVPEKQARVARLGVRIGRQPPAGLGKEGRGVARSAHSSV